MNVENQHNPAGELEARLRGLLGKAQAAARDGAALTVDSGDCAALAQGLEQLIALVLHGGELAIDAALVELLKTEEGSPGGEGAVIRLQRMVFDAWRHHEQLGLFLDATARNAQGLGRPMVLLWQPVLATFMIEDPVQLAASIREGKPGRGDQLARLLGWQVVAYADPDGHVAQATAVTLMQHADGKRITGRVS